MLRAGGAYLPIDPAQPPERRAALLAAAGARVLIAAPGAGAAGAPAVIELPSGWPGAEEPAAGERPAPGPAPGALPLDRLAYVFYTSGSTGAPKGVAVSHRALARTLAWRLAAFAPGPGDRVLQSVPPTFDPSLWQVFGALATGAALVLPERDGDPGHLGELIARERITIADFPPSLLAALLAAGALGAPSLRLVFAGGEALPPELAAAFRAASPARLINIYGPTEGAIDSACRTCDGGERGAVPIGRPVAGKRLRVAGPLGEPLPAGVPGELWIGGEGLARGYLGRPGATAECFRPDPGGGVPGDRVYRSGDRVRHRADGALEFRGRTDRQLKLRGVRIEPGEVEAALAAHPAVGEAAAGIWEPAPGDRRLAVWVAPRAGAAAADPAALRAFLAGRLPAHAVPAAYVRLAALPRTGSGKVDRAALPPPAVGDAARSAAWAPPRNEVERAVAEVFGDLLAVPSVGLDDSFFDLGGHSLLLVSARERLAARLGRADLELVDLFRHPTVRGLARRLAGGAPAPAAAAAEGEAAALRLREGRARQAERLALRRAGAGGGP